MMRALVVLLVIGSVAQAAPSKWPVDVPDGWVDRTDQMAEKLAQLRALRGTISVDGALYMSPAEDVQLTVTVFVTHTIGSSNRRAIEELDRGIVKGSSSAATRHVSDSAHWVGQQLVADQVDELKGLRFHQVRVHAADGDGNVHSAIVSCAGAAEVIAPCDAILAKIHFEVPNQVAPSEHDAFAYEMGELTGVIFAVWLVIVLVRRIRRARR